MKQKPKQTLASPRLTAGDTKVRMVKCSLFLFSALLLMANSAVARNFVPTCSPPAILSTTPGTICGIGSVTLSATSDAGTLKWYSSSTGGSVLGSGNSFTTSITSTTTFYVEAVDGTCTTAVRTAVVATSNPRPTVSPSPVVSSVCMGNTHTLSASASGGTTPYTYSWTGPDGFTSTSSSSPSVFLAEPGAGFYTVTAVDANGCSGNNLALVSVYTNPTLSSAATPNPVCTGNELVMNAGYNSGGSGNATYVWTGPNGYTATGETPVLPDVTSAAVGVYSVIATDSRGCTGTGTTSLVSVITNTVSITTTNALSVCPGSAAALSTSGAATYQWNPTTGLNYSSGSTVAASPSVTTTYVVTGNVGNCYDKDTVTVVVLTTYSVTATVSSGNGTISEVGTTNVCTGTDKTYTITPNSGYMIADVQLDGTSIGNTPPFIIHNVTSPHTITATFAPSCTTPSITASSGAAICGSGTAALSATASAGTLNWYAASTGGSSLHTGGTYSPSVTATTTFYVDATDGSCVSSRTEVTATVNPVPSASTSVTHVSCYGQSTGAVTVSGSGGTGGYTVTGSATTGLAAGSYSYTVTDAMGCTATASATVTQPSSAVSASSTVTNLTCNGDGSGAVTVSATGGTGTITGTGTFSGMTAGAYSYTVTDGNGCTATTSGTITQPSVLTASSTVTNLTCNGDASGAVTVSATGGTGTITGTGTFSGLSAGAYSYTVTDGHGCTATTSGNITQPSVLTASSTVTNLTCNGDASGAVTVSATGGTGTIAGIGTFSGLNAGSYSYTVTDASGCTATTSGSITQPSALSASSTVTNVLCNGGTSGAVVVSATGGTGTITGTGTFSGLSAGAYSYTVTDTRGCTATTSGSITQPSALSASSTVTNVLCNGGTTGAVIVSATGGTGTITGTGTFSNLSAGSYSYTVTDANGCTANTSGSITQPSALSIAATPTNVSCHSSNGGNHSDGSIATSVSGGTGTYSYAWSGGASGANPSGLTAGTYTVTVTDGNSCSASTTATVAQPSAVSATATATNISCHSSNGGNHSNGSIATSVSGGTGSYSYAWSNSSTSANPTGLSTGTYSVTVTDANSCTKTASATVGQPSALAATLTATNVSCGGSNNGSVAASVSGGTASYTYLWSNSQTGATCTGLSAATYSVTVTDASSCTTTGSATVSQATTTTCTITGSSAVLGNVANTYTGPTGMSSYSWSISGGDHICDVHCHHHSGHSCGSGCDHYGHTCSSNCHHHSSHSCSNNHTGDHHCNHHCHHHSGHTCGVGCDHNGHSCNSNCHHHSSHHCNHQHCGNTTISGSATGSSVTVVSPCCASSYTLTLTATNSTGCTSTANMAVTVTPTATITVYSTLYTVGSGNHPGVTKSVLAADLKLYTRSTSRRRSGSQNDYSTIWNSSTGRVTNVSISSPTTVTMGGGPAYRYIITVPIDGRYLVVGKSTVSSTRCGGTTCSIYTGKKLGANDGCDGDQHGRDDDDDDDLEACSDTKVRFHSVIKDQSGKCREADTRQEHGSLMLVVSPMELDFEDSLSYLPLVYESVEGDWDVTVSAEPPYGFYTDPMGELSTSVTDSVMNAVQFNVIDTGSEWTFTTVNHKIQHNGKDRIATTKPVMVNERTNKPVEVNITPNPSTGMIRVALPKFEGRATLYVYNLLGQKVYEQPIDVISGATVAMDLSSLTPGVYMVSAENTSGKASARLIKAAE